ncbi:MAG: hypothetical protein COA78_25280 [Blastopirellula sp.]|nr:MAG: hypothetical protein COA78_25280 [Blastopirellula sp.]
MSEAIAAVDDAVEVEAVVELVVEEQIAPEADSEAEAPAEPAKVEFTPEQQAKFNDEIGKKVRNTHAANRRADDLQSQLDAITAAQPAPERPAVPKVPDPYSETYQADMVAYTESVTQQASYDAGERQRSESALADQTKAREAVEEKQRNWQENWNGRVANLGIDAAEMDKAIDTLDAFNIDMTVAARIGKEAMGPDIIRYLAKNPSEADALAQMAPDDGVIHVATVLKEKAAGMKPKLELAPDPTDVLSGKGAPEGSKGPVGATYE